MSEPAMNYVTGPVALQLALSCIAPSKSNPRRTVKDDTFAELVTSVRRHGVLQPILVRPVGNGAVPASDDAFEIVAGHRRYAAAQEAGLVGIPASIRNLSEVEALELQVVENLDRKDLHPLEEAAGYKQLMKVGKYSVQGLAAKIGRSVKYVYDRVKLLELSKAAQQEFLEGRITAGHAIILARLSKDAQEQCMDADVGGLWTNQHFLLTPEEDEASDELVDYDPKAGSSEYVKPVSVRELQSWVDQHVKFDRQDVDPLLFPETYETVSAAPPAETIVAITHDVMTPEAVKGGEKVILGRSWQRADGKFESKTCEHSITGVIVIGAGRGEAFKVCTAKEKCKLHWSTWQKERTQRQKASAGDTKAKDRVDRSEEKRKKEEADRKLRAERMKKAKSALLDAAAEKVSGLDAGGTGTLAGIVIDMIDYGFEADKRMPRGSTAEDLIRHLAFARIVFDVDEAGSPWSGSHALEVLEKIGVDVEKILDEAAPVEKPEASAKPAKKKAGKKK